MPIKTDLIDFDREKAEDSATTQNQIERRDDSGGCAYRLRVRRSPSGLASG